jgi:hypothetical protein
VARTALSDYFQVFPFWLMDVAPIEPLSLPIFSPLMGFSSITSPEITLEIQEIKEANNFFTRKVITGGSAGNITLMRAAKWYDSDFYRWTMAALTGDTGGRGSKASLAIGGATPRRDLLLIQFLSRSPIPAPYSEAAAAQGLMAVQGAASTLTGGATSLGSIAAVGQAGAIASNAGFAAKYGPVEFAPRLPGKAWLLQGCLPARFKPISDLDAMSSNVSLSELEVAVEAWDEISLGSELGGAAVAAVEAAT